MVTSHFSSIFFENHEPNERQLPLSKGLASGSADSFGDSFVFKDAVRSDTFGNEETSANGRDDHNQRLRGNGIDLSGNEIQKIAKANKHALSNNEKCKTQVGKGYMTSRKTTVPVLSHERRDLSGLRQNNNANSERDFPWITLSANNLDGLYSFPRRKAVSKLTAKEIEAREKEAILAAELPALLRNGSRCKNRTDYNHDKKKVTGVGQKAQTDGNIGKQPLRSNVQKITQTEKEAREREESLTRKLKRSQQKVDDSKISVHKESTDRLRTTTPNTRRVIPLSNELNTKTTEGSTISSIALMEAEARDMAEKLEKRLQSMSHRFSNTKNLSTNSMSSTDSQKQTENRGANDDIVISDGSPKTSIRSVRDDSESREQDPETIHLAKKTNRQEEETSNYFEERRDEALPRVIVVYGDNSTISSRSDHKLGPKRAKTSFRKDIESEESSHCHIGEPVENHTESDFDRDILQLHSFPDAAPLVRAQALESMGNGNKSKSDRGNGGESKPSRKSGFRHEGSARGKRVSFAPMETLDLESSGQDNLNHRDDVKTSGIDASVRTYSSAKLACLGQSEERTMKRTMATILIILSVAFFIIMFVVLDPLRKMTRN